jgi:hypothetical protein
MHSCGGTFKNAHGDAADEGWSVQKKVQDGRGRDGTSHGFKLYALSGPCHNRHDGPWYNTATRDMTGRMLTIGSPERHVPRPWWEWSVGSLFCSIVVLHSRETRGWTEKGLAAPCTYHKQRIQWVGLSSLGPTIFQYGRGPPFPRAH